MIELYQYQIDDNSPRTTNFKNNHTAIRNFLSTVSIEDFQDVFFKDVPWKKQDSTEAVQLFSQAWNIFLFQSVIKLMSTPQKRPNVQAVN